MTMHSKLHRERAERSESCKCNKLTDRMEYRKVKILKVFNESEKIKTFVIKGSIGATPGQFCMVWVPGLGERPISIANDDGKNMSITVANVGDVSKTICGFQVGDYLRFRGPNGNGFSFPDEINQDIDEDAVAKSKAAGYKIICIAGGYGIGPVIWFAEQAKKKGCDVVLIAGARTSDLVILKNRMKNLEHGVGNAKVIITTDDGSLGFKGLVTEPLEEQLMDAKTDKCCVYGCGPEGMMYNAFKLCEGLKVDCQMSLERYMKCGVGICGSCSIAPDGWRTCVEGPVFHSKVLRKMQEFGRFYRDNKGRKVPYK